MRTSLIAGDFSLPTAIILLMIALGSQTGLLLASTLPEDTANDHRRPDNGRSYKSSGSNVRPPNDSYRYHGIRNSRSLLSASARSNSHHRGRERHYYEKSNDLASGRTGRRDRAHRLQRPSSSSPSSSSSSSPSSSLPSSSFSALRGITNSGLLASSGRKTREESPDKKPGTGTYLADKTLQDSPHGLPRSAPFTVDKPQQDAPSTKPRSSAPSPSLSSSSSSPGSKSTSGKSKAKRDSGFQDQGSGAVNTATYSAKRRGARNEGDIILGALFPVHHHPPIQTAYSRVCGKIREYYGIQRIQAFIRTVDQINRNNSILPGIDLGWDIRDSCWYSAIALEQSIDFIQDAIASKTMTRDGKLVSAFSESSKGGDGDGDGGAKGECDLGTGRYVIAKLFCGVVV
ncbi:uncharacterized protein [Littorina saxatilis]|uniref:uncharacterized protein n=1 Tax=Littorina saxatilis TaxID=31220 RepID=UPI0038B435E5